MSEDAGSKITSYIIGGSMLYAFVKGKSGTQEGDTREKTCANGQVITQTYTNGAWYPPCPEEYSLTIQVTE